MHMYLTQHYSEIGSKFQTRAVVDNNRQSHRSVARLLEGGALLGVVVADTVVVYGGLMDRVQEPTLPSLSVMDSLKSGVQHDTMYDWWITITPPSSSVSLWLPRTLSPCWTQNLSTPVPWPSVIWTEAYHEAMLQLSAQVLLKSTTSHTGGVKSVTCRQKAEGSVMSLL